MQKKQLFIKIIILSLQLYHQCNSWRTQHLCGGGHGATHPNWRRHLPQSLPLTPAQSGHGAPVQAGPLQLIRQARPSGQPLRSARSVLQRQRLGNHRAKSQ